ncbi:MAG: DUF6049 family protein [Pseudoclavibacter sp.]
MDAGPTRRLPRALRSFARTATPVVIACALALGALWAVGLVDGSDAASGTDAPLANGAAAGSAAAAPAPGGAGESVSATAGGASGVPQGRVDSAQDGAVTLFVAPGGDGALAPGDDLPVTIDIVNRTDAELPAGEVVVAVADETIDTRSAYTTWLDGSAPGISASGPGAAAARADAGPVAPGETATIEVTVASEALPFGVDAGFGPRQVAAGLEVDGAVVAEARSSIVVAAGVDAQPTPLSIVVPIAPAAGTSSVLGPERLGELTGDGGYLTQLLDAVDGTGATLAIDPRLLAMIRGLGGSAPASAREWLERLESLENDSFALPFADADLTLQSQAGLDAQLELLGPEFAIAAGADAGGDGDESGGADADGESDSPTATPTATATEPGATATDAAEGEADSSGADDATGPGDASAASEDADDATDAAPGETTDPTGNSDPADDPTESPDETGDPGDEVAVPETLEELTAFDYTLDDIAWPTAGTLTNGDLGTLAEWGYRGLIVDEGEIERLEDYDFTPANGVDLDGWSAMSADGELSNALALAASATTDGDRDAAITELSTVLAIVTRELPAQPRALLATTGHAPATDPVALGETLRAVDALGWQTPASLEIPNLAEGAEPVPRATLRQGGGHEAGAVARVGDLMASEERAGSYATMFDDADAFRSERRAALLAQLSAAWHDDREGWNDSTQGYTDYVTATEASVTITESSDIQLVGREAQLPIFVRNDTDRAVTVQVVLEPTTGRLEAGDPVTLRIEPGSMARAQVPIQAISNGNAEIDVRILTPDGVALLSTQLIQVNVQAEWETAVVIVGAVGLMTMFVWGVVRTVRRRRREKVGASSAAESPPDSVSVVSEGD